MYVKRLVTLIRHEPLWATKVCSNKTSLPLLLLLQVKCWTRTCVTTSVCSFRRAHWITSSSRSYGTTSTFAPSLVSTSCLSTLINTQATVKRKWAVHLPVSRPYKLLSEAEPDTLERYNVSATLKITMTPYYTATPSTHSCLVDFNILLKKILFFFHEKTFFQNQLIFSAVISNRLLQQKVWIKC